MAGAEEEFGRSIPECDDLVCHLIVGFGEGAGETEVGEFNFPVGCYKQVIGFNVAVENEVRMAVVDGATEHTHPGFDFGGTVDDGGVFDQFFQIAVGEELDDHVDVLVFRGVDVEESYNAGMGDLLKVLDFADRVDIETFLLLGGIHFKLFDCDDLRWV